MDTCSKHSRDDVIEKAAKYMIPVYIIYIEPGKIYPRLLEEELTKRKILNLALREIDMDKGWDALKMAEKIKAELGELAEKTQGKFFSIEHIAKTVEEIKKEKGWMQKIERPH